MPETAICPRCGRTVPEGADAAGICGACGAPLPSRETPPPRRHGLKLRPPAAAAAAPARPPAAPGLPLAAVIQPGGVNRPGRADRRQVWRGRLRLAATWLLFLVLAAALAHVRFRAGLPGEQLEILKLAGLYALGLVYLLAVILALKDNMFDGLLAVLVPGYPFYYLFFTASAWVLRAVAAALLVGFGLDLSRLVQELWLRCLTAINCWIQNV